MQKKSIQRINENRAKFRKSKKNSNSWTNSKVFNIDGKILKISFLDNQQSIITSLDIVWLNEQRCPFARGKRLLYFQFQNKPNKSELLHQNQRKIIYSSNHSSKLPRPKRIILRISKITLRTLPNNQKQNNNLHPS